MVQLLPSHKIKKFRKLIWNFYGQNKREFIWRDIHDPYEIVVSEIMLQQTQASRVIPKYEAFIKSFPTFEVLAAAPLRKVLKVWSGLGYNRRVLYLKKTAQIVVNNYKNKLPFSEKELIQLPGIGKNTAGSIMAFAGNKPVVFIETNIRTVFLHFFFKDKIDISDKEILPLIEQTLDRKNSRDWYYALMDYGVMLKKRSKNQDAKSSKHYVIQSPFEGSKRQLRGKLIRYFLANKKVTKSVLQKEFPDTRLEIVLKDFTREEFVYKHDDEYDLVENN